MTGLYRPGTSVLHRTRPGVKLAVLAVGISALAVLRSPTAVAVGIVVLVVGYALGQIPLRAAWSQVRPVRWLLLVVVVFQLLIADVTAAMTVAGTLAVAVAAAGLVTLTTRVTAMLDVFCRLLGPLRRVGIEPDRVALLMALTLRCIPVLAGVAGRLVEARRARGASRSPRALVVPLVLGTIRQADQLGEALAARGVDD